MTLNQLLQEVSALGFESVENLDDAFIFSANRALKMIFTELALPEKIIIRVGESDEKSFDLRTHVKNPFLIISAPKTPDGNIIKGAYTDGYTVTLPPSFTSEAVISYKPMPKEITIDNGEDEIEMPAFAKYLLPLLTASFVLLEDDENLADYYMDIYRTESSKLRVLYSLSQGNTYTDVTGWA